MMLKSKVNLKKLNKVLYKMFKNIIISDRYTDKIIKCFENVLELQKN